ncbi:MAG: hypothetical protein CVV22_03980 [Ignavibacteriae bacterium HGW-Ignavibacteriae-1]|jgi:8-oxo-dGTP pyrophosphatase MutT (NUDIX family)|nr:MAG: hypothetical protein CVV22_03980 [Ignavibacteriae bacterium HGW-Ignavibacteriae-1]
MTKFDTIKQEIIHANPYWVYRKNEYLMPNNKVGDYFFVETPGSVFIIPRLKDGNFVLVKQFRYLNSKPSIEFPGGGIKSAYSIEDNAKCELKEEAGLITGKIKKIGEFNPLNGVTNEICHVFFAEELSFEDNKPDAGEEFSILKFNEMEIDSLIKSGELWDGMTLAAWSLYKLCIKGV